MSEDRRRSRKKALSYMRLDSCMDYILQSIMREVVACKDYGIGVTIPPHSCQDRL